MTRATTAIVVAAIAAAGTIIGAYVTKSPPSSPNPGQKKYSGRVIDSSTREPISGAKVSLETQGTSEIKFTTDEGTYSFILSVSSFPMAAKIRVEVKNYNIYERDIEITSNDRFEEIRLSRRSDKRK